jgi:hypothetical protein
MSSSDCESLCSDCESLCSDCESLCSDCESLCSDSESSSAESTEVCQACLDEKSTEDFKKIQSSECSHTKRCICDGCLREHVKLALGEICTDDVHCPEPDCRVTLKPETIQQILSDEKDRKLLEKYNQSVTHKELEKMPEFIWCGHGCGMGQLNDGGDRNNIVTCTDCGEKTCFTHKTKWHEGLTCEQ